MHKCVRSSIFGHLPLEEAFKAILADRSSESKCCCSDNVAKNFFIIEQYAAGLLLRVGVSILNNNIMNEGILFSIFTKNMSNLSRIHLSLHTHMVEFFVVLCLLRACDDVHLKA